MSTPSAKRRRVDAANVTLRKPFRSPVIRRPDDAGPSRLPDQTESVAAEDLYSSRSPSEATIRPARSSDALRQTPHEQPSPPTLKTPVQRGLVKRKPPATGVAVESDDHHPGSALLALVRAHRHTAQDAVLKDLDRKLETVRQAKRIEEASEHERPGEAIDQELNDLVLKWKRASRMAAEEVFEIVRERVANSGGPKAWKEMRQRQMEFYQGWDQEAANRKKPDEGNGDRGHQEELEGDDGGAIEDEALQAEQQADADEEEQSEPEFNMAQMLQSLNIDPSLLGYDAEGERWID